MHFPPAAANLLSEPSVEAHSSSDGCGELWPGAPLPASTGLLFPVADFSRNLEISGRHAAALFITHNLLVFYSTVCSQVAFVCIIIWSSVI